MQTKPRMAKAHSKQVADEYVRLGWTLRRELRAAGEDEPYEYFLEWLREDEPIGIDYGDLYRMLASDSLNEPEKKDGAAEAIFSKVGYYLLGIVLLAFSAGLFYYSVWQQVTFHGVENPIRLIVNVVAVVYSGAMGLGAFGFVRVGLYANYSLFGLLVLALAIWLLSLTPVSAAIILGAIIIGCAIVIGLRR